MSFNVSTKFSSEGISGVRTKTEWKIEQLLQLNKCIATGKIIEPYTKQNIITAQACDCS